MQDCTFKPKINPKTPTNDRSFRRRETLQINDSPITLLSASPPPPKRTNIIDVISKPLLLQTSYISSQAQNVVLPLRKKEENK